MKYFYLTEKLKGMTSAFAYSPEEFLFPHEFISKIQTSSELPFELTLFKISKSESGLIKNESLDGIDEIWLDYIPNNLAWPFMSEKLKSVIDINLTGNENIRWISSAVRGKNEIRTYYLPFFKNKLDVLDVNRTIFVKGTDQVIIPWFSKKK